MTQGVELVGEASLRADGWSSVLSNLGIEGKDPRLETKFSRTVDLDWTTVEALYEENAIFARIIDAVPEHCVRRWIKVKADDAPDDFNDETLKALEALDAREKIYDLMRVERLFGGAALLIGADDGQKPDQPLQIERVRKVTSLHVFSRYEVFVSDWDYDVFSPTFREPRMLSFSSTGYAGSGLVHPSRVIRLTGIRTTDRTAIQRGGWGSSVSNRVFEPVRRFGTLYSYVEALFKDIVQSVVQIDGLNLMLSSDQGNAKLLNRLRTMQLAASAFNAILLDKSEQYERRTLSVAGLSDLMLRAMDELAAVAEMPLSVLFGQAPSGLSTDDHGGRTTFYDSIANDQQRLLRKPLKRILECVLAAEGKAPKGWDFEFLPLEEPNEKEEADTRFVNAEADEKLVVNGIISAAQARTRLERSPSNPYDLSAAPMPEDLPPPAVAPAANAPPTNGKAPRAKPAPTPIPSDGATRV